MVSDYTLLSFDKVHELFYDEYLFYLRDAFIYKLEQSREGREYLRNAYRITQAKPEREKIRERMK